MVHVTAIRVVRERLPFYKSDELTYAIFYEQDRLMELVTIKEVELALFNQREPQTPGLNCPR